MIPDEDFALMAAALAPVWPRLAGARLFFAGGTGFIGRWMLEALARAPVDVHVTVLSRDPQAFAARAPHLAARVTCVQGDVAAGFRAPKGPFTHVIHGATDASAALTAGEPVRMFDTILTGTQHLLELARAHRARFVFMSSGAVYGRQPGWLEGVDEDWVGGPDPRDPLSAYAEGKRAAETLCAAYARQYGLDIVTARIFAVLGPLLPLGTHFAAGNFIRDAMAGAAIRVDSSGEAVRSYLYAADLAVWMWRLAIDAAPGSTYNVGSHEAITIATLAKRIGRMLGARKVQILGRQDAGWNPGRYVPATHRIRDDLGVRMTVGLDAAIRRTAIANGWTPRP